MSKSTGSAELRTMPVLAVRGIVVFPGMILQFDIGRKKSVLAVKAALDAGREIFIVTQTDMFACVVTGAPPTNLEGFYNNLYGSTGTNHHGITEIGQIRMGRNVTPWSHREAYQRENPMFHADKIQTPFMILHGTADGAVD